jgi:2-dehydro-3-deoxyphosphogluconate aldolase/(4S)-4-hydroxy-2-oxoglutarate aldolase
VACVGGSWMVPGDALAARDWTRIGELAKAAAALPC